MTSQVAVYNQLGIALASDTVSTAFSDNGAKTTGNSEKIFELGDGHKVVILHYGSTGLNNLLHQFHVNEWRLSLTGSLPTLEDYVASYRDWSANGPRFHSPESIALDASAFIRTYFEGVKAAIDSEVNGDTSLVGLSEDQFNLAALIINEEVAKERLAELKAMPLFDGLTEAKARAIIKTHIVDVNTLIEQVFEGYVQSPALLRTLRSSAPYMLARRQSWRWDSTLVFAGYGEKDAFPGTITLSCRGLIDGLLVAHQAETVRIDPEDLRWELSNFAQGDAIESFLSGVNKDVRNQIAWGVDSLVRDMTHDDPNADTDFVNGKVRFVLDKLDSYTWKNYLGPIGRHISGLNVSSLANLGETLVGMQATASQSKDGPVSVGGFIEVVTIDRIEGVRWIRRMPRS
jgi:hypothetical protein